MRIEDQREDYIDPSSIFHLYLPVTNMITVTYSQYLNSYYFLQDSFVGGEDYKNPKYSTQTIKKTTVVDEKLVINTATKNSYLIPHTEESIQKYNSRLSCAVYLNLVEPIISAYCSPLEQVKRTFTDEGLAELFKTGSEFYNELDYSSFIKFVAEQTALFGHVFVVMDFITDNSGKVISLKPLVLNPIKVKEIYLSDIDYKLEGISWELSEKEETYVVLTRAGYQIIKDKKVIQQIPLKEGMPFPIKVVYFKKDTSKDYPFGISLVSDTAEIGKKIYNLASWLDEVAKNTGFPFLALPINEDISKVPPESKIAVGTANAIQYPANSGAPQYVETSGQSTEQLRQMIKDNISQAFQTKGLNSFELIDSQAASGVSIKIRNNFFESKAKTFLQNINALENWIMNFASIAMGLETVEYSIVYPTNLMAPDAAAQIQNWISLLQTAKDFNQPISSGLFQLVFEQIVNTGFSLTDAQKKELMDKLQVNDPTPVDQASTTDATLSN